MVCCIRSSKRCASGAIQLTNERSLRQRVAWPLTTRPWPPRSWRIITSAILSQSAASSPTRMPSSPSGVGYDIGCGNTCALTNLALDDIIDDLVSITDEISSSVSFGIGSKSNNRDHAFFADARWAVFREIGHPEHAAMLKLAREQLGSVGSGNHYVDVFADELDRVWIGTHFGSRGFGHRTATGFLNLARGRGFSDRAPGDGMDEPPTVLSLDAALGGMYWDAMELAGDYARAGRDLVVNQVLAIVGAEAREWVRNNHNLAWREQHEIDGMRSEVIVVRKGATPAFPGQLGFVGGSMGDDSVIVRGIDTAEAAAALRSTIHGAGRVMSRTQAAGKINWKTKARSGGSITRDMMMSWLDERAIVLRGGGMDEAPQAYKRLRSCSRSAP